MGAAGQDADDRGSSDKPPPIVIDVSRLQPLEIVLIRRYLHDLPTDGFSSVESLVDDFHRQLADLPRTNLSFARTVFTTFALSPYPVDRLNIGLMLRALTLADHEAGFALWQQLVRDEHPVVRRDVYQPIHQHLTSPASTAEEGLGQEGLTLAEGEQLRDAFIGAQYHGGCHVVGQTAVAEALKEATHSLGSIARV